MRPAGEAFPSRLLSVPLGEGRLCGSPRTAQPSRLPLWPRPAFCLAILHQADQPSEPSANPTAVESYPTICQAANLRPICGAPDGFTFAFPIGHDPPLARHPLRQVDPADAASCQPPFV